MCAWYYGYPRTVFSLEQGLTILFCFVSAFLVSVIVFSFSFPDLRLLSLPDTSVSGCFFGVSHNSRPSFGFISSHFSSVKTVLVLLFYALDVIRNAIAHRITRKTRLNCCFVRYKNHRVCHGTASLWKRIRTDRRQTNISDKMRLLLLEAEVITEIKTFKLENVVGPVPTYYAAVQSPS